MLTFFDWHPFAKALQFTFELQCHHKGQANAIMDQPPIPMPSRRQPVAVYFDRAELNLILNIYGRMVAAGHWKDYAVDATSDCAIFSVYRRASENAEYRIVKDPTLAQKQGSYAILSTHGQILKRGKSLANALKVFERKFLKVVDND